MKKSKIILIVAVVFCFSLITSTSIISAQESVRSQSPTQSEYINTKAFYKEAEILSVDVIRNDSVKNSYKKITLLKTNKKYPLVRVEDTIVSQINGNGQII